MLIYFLNSAIELPIWRYIFLFYQIFYSVFTPSNHGIYLIKWKLDRSTLKSGFFSDLEGWSLKLVLFINYMYLRHMPFLKHEEFNIRKCIHDLSGHVDRFIWVGLWISCYICTDANSLQIQSRFRVLFSQSISNDKWSFSMTHNKHIKRQFLPFISVRQGVGFLLLLLWIMANILRFFRNCFFYIYIFL